MMMSMTMETLRTLALPVATSQSCIELEEEGRMSVQLSPIYPEDLLQVLREVDRILCGNDTTTGHMGTKEYIMRTFDWKLFSARLLQRREKMGYNIQDIDDLGGMDRAYYRSWEKGEREPNVLATFARVCVFLKADPRYFLGMVDTPDSGGTSYPPTETKEAALIADIMDELPEPMRVQMLQFAQAENDVAAQFSGTMSEQNKKIINLLNGLIEATGEQSRRDQPSQSEILPPLVRRTPTIATKFDWSIFGERLKSRREELGYTQLDIEVNVGISRPYYANWENNRKTPGVIEQFRKVCIFLETDPRYFMGITDTPDPNEPGYINRKYQETTEIVKIVDVLTLNSREKLLKIAQIQQQASEEWNATLAAKNEKILNLLKRLISEVGGGAALDSDEFAQLQDLTT